MELSRRGFLGGIIAACAAPAIVHAGLIMPVKPQIVVPASSLLTPAEVTRAALIILHQKLSFITDINRDLSQTQQVGTLTFRRPVPFGIA